MAESFDELVARLGFQWDETDDTSSVVFLGPDGVAAVKPTVAPKPTGTKKPTGAKKPGARKPSAPPRKP